ncbi:MAG: hypothetical protein R2851_23035 [Caldilineaceae bacterium]
MRQAGRGDAGGARVAFVHGQVGDVPVKLGGHDAGEDAELGEHADAAGGEQVGRGEAAYFHAGNVHAQVMEPGRNFSHLAHRRLLIHGVGGAVLDDVAALATS